ncbi:glycosyltransferase [Blastococcus sp. SYSU DS0541]
MPPEPVTPAAAEGLAAGFDVPAEGVVPGAPDDPVAMPPGPRRRRLSARGSLRMRRPDGSRHYRALAVADVDLDRRTATLLPALTAFEQPAEGVHALVWFHGEPIGEITVPGDPATVLAALPRVAARECARAVAEHLLRDCLAVPGGVAEASSHGLPRVGHPDLPPVDGSVVTVAICTRDRPDDLRRCLEAVAGLDTRPADVLVVDNASRDDRTRQVAEEFGVRYVREPRAGLDWARNRALLEAGTRIVAFTDDDVLVHPCWLRGIVRAFAEEPDAVVVTGLVAPAELATRAQVLFEAFGGFGRGYARRWMSVGVASGEVAAQLYPGTGVAGTGANMALLREDALALGGFDPALDVGTPTGGGGDLEMYFRVLASGGLLVYEPTAVVRHVHRRTMPELARQMAGNGTGVYSIFAGAGPRYGPAQARALLAFGARWAGRHHLRGNLRSLLWPRVWPGAVVRADTRGMLDALGGRLYARARAQAEAESARHPHEPTAPPLVHPRPTRRSPRSPDPAIVVDLVAGRLPDPSTLRPVEDHRRARRLRVRVERDGRPQADVSIRTAGSRPSPARLRWEIVGRLGPAVLTPGASWQDVALGEDGALTPADARPAGATGAPDATAISILLVTGGGPATVPAGLAALPATSGRVLQVVVVDTTPGGGPPVATDSPGVELVHAPGLGRAAAWNAALPHLRGEVVVFLDDDVTPADGWLEALVGPFGDRSVTAVTGNVLPADPGSLEAQLLEDLGRLDGGPHRQVLDRSWVRTGRGPAPTWRIGTLSNAAIRREALHRLGELDPALGAEAGTEYLHRVLVAGGRVVYEPTAVVLRDHGSSGSALGTRLRVSAGEHVGYLLDLLVRHHDVRGLARLVLALPREYARRAWWVVRLRDDYPVRLLRAEVGGSLAGIPRWIRARGRTR